MSFFPGKKYAVFIQDENGTVIDFDAINTSLVANFDVDSMGIFDAEFRISGHPRYYGTDFAAEVRKRKTAAEWMCDFCKTPNPKKHTGCSKCGAPRSFLFDL